MDERKDDRPEPDDRDVGPYRVKYVEINGRRVKLVNLDHGGNSFRRDAPVPAPGADEQA